MDDALKKALESDQDPDDLHITSRDDAEELARDRLAPFLWHLRSRIEARIATEWAPGIKIELELNDMEAAVAQYISAEYQLQGWTVKVGGKRTNSTKNWIILE